MSANKYAGLPDIVEYIALKYTTAEAHHPPGHRARCLRNGGCIPLFSRQRQRDLRFSSSF